MTTLSTAYCNITSDLQDIEPNIESYDKKRSIKVWSVHSGTVYKSENCGYVNVLFQDGEDLGSPEANLAAVDTNGEWFYDETIDTVYLQSATDPDEENMQAGQDWKTLTQKAVDQSAEFMRAYYGQAIYSRKGVEEQGTSARNWDDIIIRINAQLAVVKLMRGAGKHLEADRYERDIMSEDIIEEVGRRGLLVMLKRGEIHLHHESGHKPVIDQVSIGGSTTGDLVDVIGDSTVNWDAIKVYVTTAGTLTGGTSSPVKITTYVRDSTGLEMSKVIDDEVITGGYDSLGRGLMGRFSKGVYTLNDEWRITMSGLRREKPKIRTMQMVY
ncbi:MAG: hypothetical protein SCARUB_05048 [Candidatus Scalindua rubra]|uniref:Uncharacterized protein n=1 Tax=Candidatus Scalindua rubra TaxID=1872076 RepID=A0A1E3X2L5_9BACT|nr:MAG: hypothetical protein SCARUB_05048 [Candidatus Scalindua rubra]